MANTYKLDILSPQGSVFSADVVLAVFPTVSGLITILAGHTALITKLSEGEIEIEQPGKKERKFITVTGGFLEVSENVVSVIADFAMRSEDVDDEKIAAAKKYAQEQKSKKDKMPSVMAEKDLHRTISSLKSVRHNKIRRKGVKY